MLTDSSKLINLYGIARLSDNRADYILCLSEQIGVDGKRYCRFQKSGVDIFNPNEANRHTKIELHLKQLFHFHV